MRPGGVGGGRGTGWGVKAHEEGRKGTLAIELLFFIISLLLLLGRHKGLSQTCKFVTYSKFLTLGARDFSSAVSGSVKSL